jgi:aryl-alcohol dehydrogenase-like predicted oxidoreductase
LRNWTPFVSVQNHYHMFERDQEREIIPFCNAHNVGILPFFPLAGGFLTGKYKRNAQRAQGVRFEASNEWTNMHFTDQAFNLLEEAEKIAAEKGSTVSQVALAWVAQQPGVTSPIIGPRTMDQLLDNLGAVDVKITDEDRARIDALVPPGREVVSYYNADFGPSKYRW